MGDRTFSSNRVVVTEIGKALFDGTVYAVQIASVEFDPTVNGDNLRLAAVAGKQLSVMSLFLSKQSSNTVKFTDGSGGAFIGPAAFSIDPISIPFYGSNFIMQTTAGNSLNFDASSARDLTIFLSYIEV